MPVDVSQLLESINSLTADSLEGADQQQIAQLSQACDKLKSLCETPLEKTIKLLFAVSIISQKLDYTKDRRAIKQSQSAWPSTSSSSTQSPNDPQSTQMAESMWNSYLKMSRQTQNSLVRMMNHDPKYLQC